MMAFRIAWFKVHEPLAFYSAYFYRKSQKGGFDAEMMTHGLDEVKKNIERIKKNPDASDKDEDLMTTLEACYEFYMRGFEFDSIDIYRSHATKFNIENGKLCFHYNVVDSYYTDVETNTALPEGQHEFGFRFECTEPGHGFGQMMIDGSPAGEPVEFPDSGFMVKSCIGVGRYASSAVKRSHKTKPDYYAYTGDYRRVDLFIGTPETIQDQLDAIELHRDSE